MDYSKFRRSDAVDDARGSDPMAQLILASQGMPMQDPQLGTLAGDIRAADPRRSGLGRQLGAEQIAALIQALLAKKD